LALEANIFTSIFNLSFTLAFLGGLLSIISPCAFTIIPAFFAISFQGKEKIFSSTLFFFLGFSIVFVLMGLTASLVGQLLIKNRELLVLIAGIFLTFFGLMLFLGKGFSGKTIKTPKRKDFFGMFFFGIAFALGWSPCVGPILGGILTIAATKTTIDSMIFLFAYSLGIWSFLLIAALAFDKWNLNNSFLKGKELSFNIAGKKFLTHTSSIISGIILMVFGIAFIVFKDALFLSNLNPFNSLELFLNTQNILFENKEFLNLFDSIIAVIIASSIFIIFFKKIWNKKTNKGNST
jgi:cytochrome c-type biogenesis protein